MKYGYAVLLGVLTSVPVFAQPEPINEAAAREALQKYEELAKANPREYLPDVADAQAKLGALYSTTQRTDQAIGAFSAALPIYRDLAKTSPENYLPDVAVTLNSLGLMFSITQHRKEAEDACNEALQIELQLPTFTSPPGCLPNEVLLTLTNIDNLDGGTQRRKDVTWAERETLKDFRDLATANPQAYLPCVALALRGLAFTYTARTRQLDEAAGAYTEMLQIYRELAKTNPQYREDVATTLNTLGRLYQSEGHDADATPFCAEAKAIFTDLAVDDPARYSSEVDSVCVDPLF